MSLLQKLGMGQGYLKAGLLGFPKSGKTYTATLLAIGTRKFFGASAPIAFFDTEGGSEYVAEMIARGTGASPIGLRSRSFQDLMAVAKECEQGAASILLVDSITHVWRELCDAYLAQVNEQLARKSRPKRTRLEFQDWNQIKAAWAQWTDWYLNSKLHCVIVGRAGWEYEFEKNEDTGKKELIKSGIKMKVESEFGFEPSLLVEMDRQQIDDGGKTRLVHAATVLGDRFGVIDGRQCNDPTFDFFLPHVQKLKPGTHAPIDTAVKTDVGIDEDGDAAWHKERRDRAILCEEIQGELVNAHPGQTAPEKKAKIDLIWEFFKTRSWTQVENLDSRTLRAGLVRLRERLHGTQAPEQAKVPEPPAPSANGERVPSAQTAPQADGRQPGADDPGDAPPDSAHTDFWDIYRDKLREAKTLKEVDQQALTWAMKEPAWQSLELDQQTEAIQMARARKDEISSRRQPAMAK